MMTDMPSYHTAATPHRFDEAKLNMYAACNLERLLSDPTTRANGILSRRRIRPSNMISKSVSSFCKLSRITLAREPQAYAVDKDAAGRRSSWIVPAT